MSITLHVRSLKLRVEQETNIKVLWSRGKRTNNLREKGKQKVDCKVKVINPETGIVNLNEKFQITTAIDFDSETDKPCTPKIVSFPLITTRSLSLRS